MIATEPVITFSDIRLTRRQVEDVLLLPGKVPDYTTKEGATELRNRLTQNPDEAIKLGLRQVPVFAVYAYDGAEAGEHRWSIREQKIWVDHATNKPIDGVVEILDSLPLGYESFGRKALLALLPPTYCRRMRDAEGLVKVLTELGNRVDLDECRFRPVAKSDPVAKGDRKAIARFNTEMEAAERVGISEHEINADEHSQGISLDLAVAYDGSIVGVSILRAGGAAASDSTSAPTAEVRVSPRVRDDKITHMLLERCLSRAAEIADLERVKVIVPVALARE